LIGVLEIICYGTFTTSGLMIGDLSILNDEELCCYLIARRGFKPAELGAAVILLLFAPFFNSL
jgi:hypothetical protein